MKACSHLAVKVYFHSFFEVFVGTVPDLLHSPYKLSVSKIDHFEVQADEKVWVGIILRYRAEDDGICMKTILDICKFFDGS